jgi:hypothetical protein
MSVQTRGGFSNLLLGIILVSTMLVISTGCVSLQTAGLSGDGSSAPSSPNGNQPKSSSSSAVSYATLTDPVFSDRSPIVVRDLSQKGGEVGSENLRISWRSHTPLFQATFSPKYYSQAIKVNVMKGPLLVNYRTVPLQYDPRVSFLVITIRDMGSGEIVAQDGYGEPFTSTPEKQMIVYGDGVYHINVYGNQVDVTVSVYTGDSL